MTTAPPSRHNNPFATCWTRPGALTFRFPDGRSAEQLVDKLAVQNWWGAIVGPHGSGKSTLLETLKPALRAAGCHVRAIAIRKGQRHLPREFLTFDGRGTLVVIDGYEQLGWLAQARLRRHCRRTASGLLVTTHAATRIPTLIRLAPDERVVQQLVVDLCAEVPAPITAAHVAASYACHGSNVREIFFDLYDRYERRRSMLPQRNVGKGRVVSR